MHRPLLAGRLIAQTDGSAILVGAPDSVRRVNAADHPVVRSFDGHRTAVQVANSLGLQVAAVTAVAERYAGPRFVVELDDWNKLHWDPELRTYVNVSRVDPGWRTLTSDQRARLRGVPLSPPCDPWICLDEERSWIARRLAELTDQNISSDVFLLCNNGLRDGIFFWEVVLEGEVVAKVIFHGEHEQDWEWRVLPGMAKVDVKAHVAEPWQAHRDRLLKANEAVHQRLVDDTIAFIQVTCEQSPGHKPLIYFSGGKESLVTLDLFRRAGRGAQLLFAATGLDFHEDNAFIRECAAWIDRDPDLKSLFQLHIEEADPEAAEGLLNKKAQLGPKDMWCRSQVKYPIRSRAVEKLYPNGVAIAFEGSRWYETDYRRGHPRINEIQDISGYRGSRQRWAHALADWNGLDIWTHIFANKLPVNPLYLKGFQRTTCWMCPLIVPFHTAQSKRQNPTMWARIEGVKFEGLETVAPSAGKALPV